MEPDFDEDWQDGTPFDYPQAQIDNLQRQNKFLRRALLIAAAIAALQLVVSFAHAQPSEDPQTRALKAVNGELSMAWIGARTALIATQDQLLESQAKVKALEAQRAITENQKFNPIQPNDPAAAVPAPQWTVPENEKVRPTTAKPSVRSPDTTK